MVFNFCFKFMEKLCCNKHKNWSPYREVEVVRGQVRGPRAAAPGTAWPVRAASGRSEDVGSVTALL